MKLWILITLSTASLLFNGCNSTLVKPEAPKEILTDETLPKIELTRNGVVRDMNAIAFEWKSLEDTRVKGIYVYKQLSKKGEDQKKHFLYKTIQNRFVTHYVDHDIQPNTKYAYSFKTFSKDAQSLSSKAVYVKSLPVLQSVTWAYVVTGMPRSAKLIWRPHVSDRVQSYIIERRSVDEKEYQQIAIIDGRLSAEYIDTNLKDDHMYLYKIRVKTFDGIVSSASKILKATTKVLPKNIKHLTGTTDLPKKILLNWDKSTTKDFYQYYVYRAEVDSDEFVLIATLFNNTFVDHIQEDGKKYKYKVSVVDVDGLESEHNDNTIVASTLKQPHAPKITTPKILNENVVLKWYTNDKRIKSYVVLKKYKLGWFKEIKKPIENIPTTEYIDEDIKDGIVYSYKVFGVDKYGITSDYSNEVKIEIPKTKNSVELQNNISLEKKKDEEVTKEKVDEK